MKKFMFSVMAAVFASISMAQEAAPAQPAKEAAPAQTTKQETAVQAPAAQESSLQIQDFSFIPRIDLDLQYASRYMSDGKIVNPEDMMFGDVCLSWKLPQNFGIYGGVWGALDLNSYFGDDSGIDHDFEEIDYYGGITYKWDDIAYLKELNFDLSLTYWDFPSRTGWLRKGTSKWNAKLKVETGRFFPCEKFSVVPGFKVEDDFENEEWQASVFANTTYQIIPKLAFDCGAELFWNNGQRIVNRRFHSQHLRWDKNCLTTFVVSADLKYDITENISFGPFCKFSWAVDHTFRDLWKEDGNPNSASGCNNVWGVRLHVNF